MNKDKHSLLNRWKNKSNKESYISTISKAPTNIQIPLSKGQQRLWFLQQLYPKNPFYNYCESYLLKGHINQEFLLQSIENVFRSNSVLRSSYHVNDGKTYQKIHDSEIAISIFDLSNLEKAEKTIKKNDIINSAAKAYFDLSIFPLVRTSLIKLSEVEHVLIINMHHIITDKWSMGIFREEMADHYRKLCAGESLNVQKGLQYGDYAFWQSKQGIDSNQFNYWKENLSGVISNLELPLDFPRKVNSSFKGAFNAEFLNDDLSGKILGLARKLETTPYVLLLSVFNLLLFKYTRQNDILIGSPVSNRSEKALEKLIGFFNDTVVLRSKLSRKMTFVDLVNQIKQTTLEAFSNKDVPFELLVKELKPSRSLSINPFFQVMFLYHSVPEKPEFGRGIQLEYSVLDLGIAKFDLTLYVAEENGKLSTTFEYDTDLFKESTIKRFQKQFEMLLSQIVYDENRSLDQISILTEEEKTFFNFSEANIDNDYKGIHDIISNQARKKPNSCAAVFEGNTISYLELDQKSNQIAINLQKYTHGENRFVGLCIDRSLEMIIGLVGILKAGCAYLPIDPDYPNQRIEFMLNDANVEILLTNEKLLPKFRNKAKTVVNIDHLCNITNDGKIDLPKSKEYDYAYLIYTSGSSGKPKGVPVTHKNIINSTTGRTKFYGKDPSSFLLMSSIAFDSSKAGVFWTLCTGGKLIVSGNRLEQDINALITTILQNRVSHILMLPSLYKLLLENSDGNIFPNLKTVIVAGEACNPLVCDFHFALLPEVLLFNEYGPTEATVWCIAHKINKSDTKGKIPIGKPVANAKIFLLDEQLNQVPYGASGEIYIGGPGVTNGYLNNKELTQKMFISNTFEKSSDSKLYKTGDLGRFRYDGSIEFLGRDDQQIKIRGFRIELEEIEKSLCSTGMIKDAVVNVETVANEVNLVNMSSPSHEEFISLIMEYLKEDDINELISSVEFLQPEERKFLLENFDK